MSNRNSSPVGNIHTGNVGYLTDAHPFLLYGDSAQVAPDGERQAANTSLLEECRHKFDYNPDTGVLTWKNPMPSRAKRGDRADTSISRGYRLAWAGGKRQKAHRIAWLMHYGVWPTGEIDHINCVKDDNRIVNLRDVDRFTNKQNIRKTLPKSISGVLGASRSGKRWIACLHIKGKRTYIGTFSTPQEAHEAYVKAKRIHHPGCTL